MIGRAVLHPRLGRHRHRPVGTALLLLEPPDPDFAPFILVIVTAEVAATATGRGSASPPWSAARQS